VSAKRSDSREFREGKKKEGMKKVYIKFYASGLEVIHSTNLAATRVV
jgi:hypothetical protein